ncbi:MAG: sulfoxide reductase heme-binding subunit YedZ [Acidobacteria bacterium]|nr:sulfoxide reductase heme-binding subunit YedZ [Acidobacteriota bacterium]
MNILLRGRAAKPIAFLLCLVPLALLAARVLLGALGANPVEAVTHFTGDWTLRFLLATLAITPARRLLEWPDLIRFRRMLGLWAFFYGTLHLATWVCLDKFFDPADMWADVTKRRFITMGMAGFALMVPLAITSTSGWIRRLGKRWRLLHRLAYLSAAAGVVHYWWLVKSDVRAPLLYGVVLATLLGARLMRRDVRPA